MIGIVVVSHSATAAEGICELAAQMSGDVSLVPAGGDGDEGDSPIGTSVDRIQKGLEKADDGDGVVVLVDLGSAVMNTELAIEMTDANATIADAPILEGTLNAAVEATSGDATIESIIEKAEDAREYRKLN